MRASWTLGLIAVVLPIVGSAALPDEIEVLDDVLTHPANIAPTLHLNTSPSGRTTPDYPGEIPPHKAWRTMLELAYGISENLEAGLHIPFLRDREGALYAAGLRPRMRWIPVRPAEGSAGPFLGFNLEYSQVGDRFERPARHLEWKLIGGWREPEWLVSVNPALTAWLSDSPKPNPEFTFNAAAKRRFNPTDAIGIEYYSAYGPLGNFHPPSERDRTLFLVADVRLFGSYQVNAGFGRGLTPHTDHSVVKLVVSFPWGF